MRHNQERKRKLRLSRARPSQPPGRGRRVLKGHGSPARDEVKGVCPESDPEPRECMEIGEGRSLAEGRRQQARGRQRRAPRHTPGVTDSIGSAGGYVATRRRVEPLGDELPGYLSATTPGSGGESSPSGMGAGLASKRGNSRGVKAPTIQSPWKGKHQRHTESGTN